jgi:thiamine-phosphate pyrophosphorylase
MHSKFLNKYHFINKFDEKHLNKQEKGTALIYRNYTTEPDTNVILKLRNYCKKKRVKFLISNNFKLAINLHLDGVYIPSFNKSLKHLSYSYSKKLLLIGSAHNIKEIRIKELQKVKIIFLSSIFKKNKNYLGIKRFKNLSLLTKKKIVALGGISNKNLKLLNLVNCFGLSGISFFE